MNVTLADERRRCDMEHDIGKLRAETIENRVEVSKNQQVFYTDLTDSLSHFFFRHLLKLNFLICNDD